MCTFDHGNDDLDLSLVRLVLYLGRSKCHSSIFSSSRSTPLNLNFFFYLTYYFLFTKWKYQLPLKSNCRNGESRYVNSQYRQTTEQLKGERYDTKCIQQSDQYGGGSVIVWAGISSEYRTELVLFKDKMLIQKFTLNIV